MKRSALTSILRNALLSCVMVLATLFFVQTVQAQTWSDWGSIREIEAGWSLDTMAIYHTAATIDPSGCGIKASSYATNPGDPGHNLFHTVALSAFLNRKEVRFLILGCVFGKPQIIAVHVR